MLQSIHHAAIICSDYEKSRHFYTVILGLSIIDEVYREERKSHMLNLALPSGNIIELFSFPDTPARLSYPEARGLRHLAFAVESVEAVARFLQDNDIEVEPIRVNDQTGKKYTFFSDPDDLPLELCEL